MYAVADALKSYPLPTNLLILLIINTVCDYFSSLYKSDNQILMTFVGKG